MESHGSVISLLSPGAHAAPAPRSSNAFWPCCTTTPTACTYSWLVEREEGQESNIEHHLHATSTTLSEIIERRGGGLSPLTNTRRPLGRASHALWHAAGGGRLCGHVCAIREGNPRHVISTKSRPGGGVQIRARPPEEPNACRGRDRPFVSLARTAPACPHTPGLSQQQTTLDAVSQALTFTALAFVLSSSAAWPANRRGTERPHTFGAGSQRQHQRQRQRGERACTAEHDESWLGGGAARSVVIVGDGIFPICHF